MVGGPIKFGGPILIVVIIVVIALASYSHSYPIAWFDTGKVSDILDGFNGAWYATYYITTSHHGSLILDSNNATIVIPGSVCDKVGINLSVNDIVGIIYRPTCGYEIRKHF